jgi:Flp pilus assembly protein TadB
VVDALHDLACLALMDAAGWLALAAGLMVLGTSRRNAPVPARRGSTALALDLGAALLRAGRTLPATLRLIAATADLDDGEVLSGVGRMLELGAHPDEAWRLALASSDLGPLATAARRSAESGARLADAFERAAVGVRAEARTAAELSARRVGVWAIAPLGLCFLPAFVCLGIVPVIAGLLSDVLT